MNEQGKVKCSNCGNASGQETLKRSFAIKSIATIKKPYEKLQS